MENNDPIRNPGLNMELRKTGGRDLIVTDQDSGDTDSEGEGGRRREASGTIEEGNIDGEVRGQEIQGHDIDMGMNEAKGAGRQSMDEAKDAGHQGTYKAWGAGRQVIKEARARGVRA